MGSGDEMEDNFDKSYVASLPPMQQDQKVGGQLITKATTLASLGAELPLNGRAKTYLPQERHSRAQESLTRIATLKLPLHITQQLVECIVIPKTCFHVQARAARPLQDIWCERLRRAINVATRMKHRGHSPEIVSALFRRPHRYDPHSAAMYSHITAVLRILRQSRADLGDRLESGRDTCEISKLSSRGEPGHTPLREILAPGTILSGAR